MLWGQGVTTESLNVRRESTRKGSGLNAQTTYSSSSTKIRRPPSWDLLLNVKCAVFVIKVL